MCGYIKVKTATGKWLIALFILLSTSDYWKGKKNPKFTVILGIFFLLVYFLHLSYLRHFKILKLISLQLIMSFSIYFLDSKKYLCYIKYSTDYFVWKNLLLQKHKFGLRFGIYPTASNLMSRIKNIYQAVQFTRVLFQPVHISLILNMNAI